MNNYLKENRTTIWCVVITTVVSIILLKYVFYLGYIPSESMEPTIDVGNIIIGTRNCNDLNENDIVIFENENRTMVKRIAAKEDDYVEYKNSKVLINGIEKCSTKNDAVGTFQVNKDQYYMLGDNYDHSYDSREWNKPCIEKNQVLAKVVWVIPS